MPGRDLGTLLMARKERERMALGVVVESADEEGEGVERREEVLGDDYENMFRA